MAISGQGILTGSLARACLTGRFAIVDTQVRLNRSRPVIATLPVAGLEDGQELFFREEARRPSRWLALDADFYSGQPVSVEGRGLASSWDVALHVGGTADAPELRGAATMRDGRLHFMGHRFELARARLLLDGAWPPLPALAGEASAKAGGIEAHLRLSGTLAQPRLDLRSTPDLPPEEIVSRLLFGHESQGISPFQAARLAYGLEVLRGEQPLFDMLERGQDLIRADELEFTQDDDSHGSALAVGKRLGERVTLRGEKGFGGASDRVLLQIELLPSLILETEAGTQMREGVGLRWRLDY